MKATLVLSDVGDQTWGVVLEDGEVVEIHVENAGRPGIAGNIYKGRISRVLPGMQSAFIDIGVERDAFLHVVDLAFDRPSPTPFEPDLAGDEDADGLSGAPGKRVYAPPRARPAGPPIQDLVREGQEILVQVTKEPIGSKGARVTAQIALPGRSLVHLPTTHNVLVSRRIEDAAERERLKDLVAGLDDGGSGGWIVRTATEGCDGPDLERDGAYLLRLWNEIREKAARTGAPALVHADLGLAERLLRDVVTEDFAEVIVDSRRLNVAAEAFLRRAVLRPPPRLRWVEDGRALFDEMGIHVEIERSSRSRVHLKSGGSIVVNPTEALVVIDVNTGRYVGSRDLEATALETNLEAVREIVRQLRLRDLGGIIVIDFIDMIQTENREALSQALYEELRKDRSRTKPLGMSAFGLVQLTRKRTRRSLDRTLQTACPACGGEGRIRSAMALYYQIQRDLARGAGLVGGMAADAGDADASGGPRAAPDTAAGGPTVRIHPRAAERLAHEGLRLRLRNADAPSGAARPPEVRILSDASLSEEEYEVIW